MFVPPPVLLVFFFFIWTSQEGKRYFTLGFWVTARGAGCVCCRVWACYRNRDMKYLEGGGRSGGNENSRRHRSVQKKWPVSGGKFKSFIVGLRDTAAVYRSCDMMVWITIMTLHGLHKIQKKPDLLLVVLAVHWPVKDNAPKFFLTFVHFVC